MQSAAKLLKYYTKETVQRPGESRTHQVVWKWGTLYINNFDTNLEWVTPVENMKHSVKQGRQDKVHILGGLATAKIQEKIILEKLKNFLGSRLVSSEVINKRRYVTFTCKHCQNTFRRRSDSPWIVRGGICRDCYKDEDMVWTA